QSRLAHVRIPDQPHIGEQLQFKPVCMLLARPASFVFPRSLVHRGGKARIPAPSAASARDDEALIGLRKLESLLASLIVVHDRAHRNIENQFSVASSQLLVPLIAQYRCSAVPAKKKPRPGGEAVWRGRSRPRML